MILSVAFLILAVFSVGIKGGSNGDNVNPGLAYYISYCSSQQTDELISKIGNGIQFVNNNKFLVPAPKLTEMSRYQQDLTTAWSQAYPNTRINLTGETVAAKRSILLSPLCKLNIYVQGLKKFIEDKQAQARQPGGHGHANQGGSRVQPGQSQVVQRAPVGQQQGSPSGQQNKNNGGAGNFGSGSKSRKPTSG